jgi:hypothetical protein
MKIYYISLGSFCYPKIVIRQTNREYAESLPFDFNSSPNLNGITAILKELHETGTYNIELKDIQEIYNKDELSVSEKNMYLVHFFKDYDLIKNIASFPANAHEYIKEDVINRVKYNFKKRFNRLYKILNDPSNILCFMRVENYDNHGWKYELDQFTKILSLFKNPNKYLIYTQTLIDEHLDYKITNVLNYDYHVPILFCKYYFYDKEFLNDNINLFINILNYFENLINNKNIIKIKNNNIIEHYYLNKDTFQIFKLSNMKYFSNYYIDTYNNILYINNVITGYNKYIKCDDNEENNIYIQIDN